jgi:hypothetical protein
MNLNALVKRAVKAWGVKAQLGMVMEECAELIVAVNKMQRTGDMDKKIIKVLEEVADVEIMLEKLKYICGPVHSKQNIEIFKRIKMARLDELLKKQKEDSIGARS